MAQGLLVIKESGIVTILELIYINKDPKVADLDRDAQENADNSQTPNKGPVSSAPSASLSAKGDIAPPFRQGQRRCDRCPADAA
jgi:hypothetical protein